MFQEVKTGDVDYAFGMDSPAISAAGPFIAVFTKVPMIAIARKGLSLKTLEDLRGFSEVGYLRAAVAGLVDGDAADPPGRPGQLRQRHPQARCRPVLRRLVQREAWFHLRGEQP